MNTISLKTVSYIIYLLKSELPEVYAEQPRHDKTHANPKVDYTNIILEQKLKGTFYAFSQTLINFIQKQDKESVRQLLYGLDINNLQ